MEHAARSVEVTTPSRLHLGMFSFGRADMRQFGGVGLMIDRPGLQLRFTPAKKFSAHGPMASRVVEFAERWLRNSKASALPRCLVEIVTAPPQHSGLGVGTQLGLATAAGLNAAGGMPRASSIELAALVDRGLRSSVGIYGFDLGGLIVESGKLIGEAISPLAARVEVPSDWRVVLVQPEQTSGLSGGEEQQAFATAPAVPEKVTAALWAEVETQLLPAARAGNFEAFSESVYRFGHTAGLCFAEIQGGAYNGAQLSEIVAAARRLGVAGVGQSSWGPTIFCLLRDEQRASEFIARMRLELTNFTVNYTLAAPANCGTQIKSLI